MREVFFWDERSDKPEGHGGIYYRAFDLIKFIEKIESDPRNFGKVIGIRIDQDSYNVEFITENKAGENDE